MTTERPPLNRLGKGLRRLEAVDKVTGRADYTHHVSLPGMLHAKIVRSHVAHGRLRSIDTTAAKAVPGVYGVFTGADILKVIP